jgi:sugar/nucleoside kinase (ribokinase family)
MVSDIYAAIRTVIDTFQRLGISYHIGGSVASSALGVARTTLDVDLVADIQADHVETFVETLQSEYYVDKDMIAQATEERSSFNLIHLATMVKVDVFILKESDYAREAFSRKRLDRLGEESEEEVYIASAEDVILHKLDWFRMGGEVSERQWGDIVGVMKVQGEALDGDYLQHWASELGLTTMLERALREAGLKRDTSD